MPGKMPKTLINEGNGLGKIMVILS